MKKLNYIVCASFIWIMSGCSSSFLERVPQGELSEPQLISPEGVEGVLIGAYGLLNGNVNDTWGNYASAPSQWLFGEVAADNAHKGSNNSDQPFMNQIELYQPTANNDNLFVMWTRCYEGIARSNNTLRLLEQVQNGGGARLSDTRAIEVEAEARMLRAHYYFFLKRVFVNIPFIDQTIPTLEAVTVPNNVDVYPHIEADLRFAADNLPTTKPLGQVGRVDRYAAQAYLGKVLLYLERYSEALPLFQSVIAAKPHITALPFTDNFDVTRENGPESIFAVQHAINPDGSGDNANVGDMLAGFYGTAPVNCCGFYQPTFDLVNAYKVNSAGLPYLDNTFRDNPFRSDFGLSGTAKTNYQVDRTIAFDPRLDYTVGRRGVPFRDWGLMQGDAWIRDPAYAGPFVGIKHTIEAAQFDAESVQGANWVTGLNVNIIRLADVYLMAAECQVELGDLAGALALVNAVRARASQLPPKLINGQPAANYQVAPYPSFPDATYARTAVQFERRLELAMEGHRFFDLVRWGIAKQVLESYSEFEGSLLSSFRGLTFNQRNEYYPIPQDQIDRSQGALVQNSGY